MIEMVMFTGTRKGMTDQQKESLKAVFDGLPEAFDFRHGMCVGADEEAHKIAQGCLCRWILGHPSNIPNMVADCPGLHKCDPLPPLYRNRLMVDGSVYCIAAPYEPTEQQRGGTWSTIRYIRKQGKPLALILPDGTVQYERWEATE